MEGGVTHEISHVRVLSLLSRVSLLFHVSRLCSLARSLARSLGLFSLCLFSLALSRSHSFSSLSLAQSLALSILSLSHSLALFSHVCMHTHAHARTHARTHAQIHHTARSHNTHKHTHTHTHTHPHTTHTSTRTTHPPTCCLNEGSFSTSAHALDTHILERLILAGRQQDAPLWIWGAGRLLRKGGREEGREGSHTKFRTCACSLCSRVSLFSSESLFSLLSRALCQSLLSLFSRASLLSSLARALSVSSLSVCLLYTTQLAHTTHTSTRTRTPTRTQHTHTYTHPPVALTKGVSAPVLTLLTRISLSASYSPADNKTRPCGSGVPGAC